MYFANRPVYWHWNSFIPLALKLMRHFHPSDYIYLVFWTANWNSQFPATDHITCGGSGSEKKQRKHPVQLTERRSWFSWRKCCWTIKLRVPLTVGGLSWLALVFSWGYHQLKSFSGLIHRRIINRRLQGFPSNFLRGKPWVRFVRGLS